MVGEVELLHSAGQLLALTKRLTEGEAGVVLGADDVVDVSFGRNHFPPHSPITRAIQAAIHIKHKTGQRTRTDKHARHTGNRGFNLVPLTAAIATKHHHCSTCRTVCPPSDTGIAVWTDDGVELCKPGC